MSERDNKEEEKVRKEGRLGEIEINLRMFEEAVKRDEGKQARSNVQLRKRRVSGLRRELDNVMAA